MGIVSRWRSFAQWKKSQFVKMFFINIFCNYRDNPCQIFLHLILNIFLVNNNLSFAQRPDHKPGVWIESNESFCNEPFLIHLRVLFIIEYYSVNTFKGRLGVVRSKEEKIKEKICSFSPQTCNFNTNAEQREEYKREGNAGDWWRWEVTPFSLLSDSLI